MKTRKNARATSNDFIRLINPYTHNLDVALLYCHFFSFILHFPSNFFNSVYILAVYRSLVCVLLPMYFQNDIQTEFTLKMEECTILRIGIEFVDILLYFLIILTDDWVNFRLSFPLNSIAKSFPVQRLYTTTTYYKPDKMCLDVHRARISNKTCMKMFVHLSNNIRYTTIKCS